MVQPTAVSSLLLLLSVCLVSEGDAYYFNPARLLGCMRREYTYEHEHREILPNGEEVYCKLPVTVDSCFGRCDTSEIPDWKVPYKISHHPVCTYGGKTARQVVLRGCDPRIQDPVITVFDATLCGCRPCSGDDTSCENLNG